METFIRQPENTFALILMDIRMPLMDGNEAARTIPIIAMTANAFAENMQQSAHLAKQIIPRQLYRIVWNCVRRKGYANE